MITTTEQQTLQANTSSDKIKIMLVDNSAVIRGLIARILSKDPDVEIVGSVANGQSAISTIKSADPDIIILDIEMPVMDGITALPLLLREKPDTKILMCSTLSHKGASISLKALSLGATDCITKPTSSGDISGSSGSDAFQDNLLRLIRSLCGKPMKSAEIQSATSTVNGQKIFPAPQASGDDYKLKDDTFSYKGKPSILAIGSSTGGPQALFKVIKNFKNFTVPIVITQHMPKTFTAILAKHIQDNCGVPCWEGQEGMAVESGQAYVAPGGYHMTFKKDNGITSIVLNEGPAENYCKPSVDPMMRSLIDLYGNRILGVMLTGMGHDGLSSFSALAEKGGRIIAQDKQTSTVWGMPRAVAMAGICSAVKPLDQIGPWVKEQF